MLSDDKIELKNFCIRVARPVVTFNNWANLRFWTASRSQLVRIFKLALLSSWAASLLAVRNRRAPINTSFSRQPYAFPERAGWPEISPENQLLVRSNPPLRSKNYADRLAGDRLNCNPDPNLYLTAPTANARNSRSNCRQKHVFRLATGTGLWS